MVMQFFGAFAVLAGVALLWSPWLLIVAGVVMILAPEVWEAVKR